MAIHAHVGDVGVVIQLTVRQNGTALNVAAASDKKIKIYKPNGAMVERTATFVTDGTNGQVQCVTQSGDLDVAGKYSAVAYLALSGWSGHSTPYRFTVGAVGE